eukprot:1478040-Pyramimonas_sp.AAC.1
MPAASQVGGNIRLGIRIAGRFPILDRSLLIGPRRALTLQGLMPYLLTPSRDDVPRVMMIVCFVMMCVA